MAPVEGFKTEGCKSVLNRHNTAVHKRRNCSTRRVRFSKSEDFSNLYIGKVRAFDSGLWGIAHGGG